MAVTAKPKINGGDYTAIDTQDGWYILRNIPTLAPVKKGQKLNSEDIGEEWFKDAVKFGQTAYQKGKIAYPIHLTHNDDQGLHNPEFAGYFTPSKVDRMDLPELGQVPVVFSDFKIKKNIFEKMQNGELGYVSPEVRGWSKRRISSVALLDSQPPHNPFPLMTIGEVKVDPTAKFEASLPEGCKIAKFADGFERVTFDPSEDKEEPETTKEETKPMADVKANQDEQAGKPNAKPVEQTEKTEAVEAVAAKMTLEDPKLAAKFAAMEDANAALKKRLDERDAQDKAKALESWALGELVGYQVGNAAKKSIAKFSQQGEAALKEHVEMLKEITPKDSPRTFADSPSVSVNDPAVAKFAQQGPEKMEAAAKFASDYRALKNHPAGRGMNVTEEQFVKFQMDAMENSEAAHWGINLGSNS